MELPVREQWMRNLIAEWAGTARELRALARWCDDQAAQMERLNDDPITRPGRQVVQVYRHGPTGTLYQLERKRCGKPTCRCAQPGGEGHGPYWYAYWREGGKTKSKYIGKELQPEHFFDSPAAPTPAQPTDTAQTR